MVYRVTGREFEGSFMFILSHPILHLDTLYVGLKAKCTRTVIAKKLTLELKQDLVWSWNPKPNDQIPRLHWSGKLDRQLHNQGPCCIEHFRRMQPSCSSGAPWRLEYTDALQCRQGSAKKRWATSVFHRRICGRSSKAQTRFSTCLHRSQTFICIVWEKCQRNFPGRAACKIIIIAFENCIQITAAPKLHFSETRFTWASSWLKSFDALAHSAAPVSRARSALSATMEPGRHRGNRGAKFRHKICKIFSFCSSYSNSIALGLFLPYL